MIDKVSHTPAWWPKITSGLRKITNLPPNVRSVLDSNSLVYDQVPPAGVAANAKAFVTTEDTNEDGKLDTVHLVVTNIEKEIPADILGRINEMSEDDPIFRAIAENIAATLVHEVAHIEDYNPDLDNPFPGGEAVAESKERAFNPVFAKTTINNEKDIGNALGKVSHGDYFMNKELVKLANDLDQLGHRDLADMLDSIISKIAEKSCSQSDYSVDHEDGEEAADLGGHEVEEVAEETAAELGDEINDFEIEANSSQNRINKMAELMAGEFTNNVPGHYR